MGIKRTVKTPNSSLDDKSYKLNPKKQKQKIAPTGKRHLKKPKYKHFRLQKKLRHEKGTPVRLRVLLARTSALLKACWKPVLVITFLFTLMQLMLVRGFSAPLNVAEFKQTVNEAIGEKLGNVESAATVVGALFGSQSSQVSEASNAYNFFITLFIGLSFIWIYRQTRAGNKFKVKEAIYRSPYPIVVVLLILLVIALQTLPFVIGSTLFQIVMQNGIAVNAYEEFIWWLLLGSTGLLSLYMISSSVFAVFVATLPSMTPMKALRSARNLVRHRRLHVMGRIIGFAFFILLAGAGIMLPLIFFWPAAAGWTYFALTSLLYPYVLAFFYTLYRELL
jgi:hypothetical protein